ncbi:MAG: CCA tRNA nucleotidyltransferase [Bacilli bacterium]
MFLPTYVVKALQLLEQNGYIAVVVGGAVRDFLLGKEPSDYDISTSATPNETIKVFSDYYVLDFGKKHGTITVFLDHHQLEITTFRIESGYEDFRHPNKTQFVRSLEQDLQRRDFTINALCFNRELIDLVNGQKDLEHKIIRAIGHPEERFNEDPLRIMRGLRFAANLGFTIEEKTHQAIINLMPLISRVSKERIHDEMNRFLMGEASPNIFSKYGKTLMNVISPTIAFDFPTIIKRISVSKGLYAKIAAIYLDLSLEQAKRELKSLKYSNDEINKITMFWEASRINWHRENYFLRKLLSIYAYEDLTNMLDFYQNTSLKPLNEQDEVEIQKRLKTIIENEPCLNITDLAINGKQLIALGIPHGKKINLILHQLLDEIMQEKLTNDEQTLLKRALGLYQERS